MDKNFVLKTFNNHLTEFMDDILLVFPREVDVKTSRTFILGAIKVKKRIGVEAWFNGVYKPYKEKIDNKDFEFFLNKDYPNRPSFPIGKRAPYPLRKSATPPPMHGLVASFI